MTKQEWWNVLVGVFLALNTLALVSRVRNVDRNNARVLDEYEDLARWARDELQAEAEQLETTRELLAARGMLDSGQTGFEDRRIRDEFARRWRDRHSLSKRTIRDTKLSEGAVEWLWRKARARPWPEDPEAEATERVTRGWEERAV